MISALSCVSVRKEPDKAAAGDETERTDNVNAGVTRGAAPAPAATSLSAESGRPVSFRETCAAIADEAKELWQGSWTGGTREPKPGLLRRFADPTWTWRR